MNGIKKELTLLKAGINCFFKPRLIMGCNVKLRHNNGDFFMTSRFFTAAMIGWVLSSFSLYGESLFKVVVLGCNGGPKDTNISGYLIAPKEANEFVALDAGSLLEGIYVANEKNSFQEIKIFPGSDLNFEIEILRNHIKGYLISHAHLEHVAGLVICSNLDTNKPIYGIDSTIDFMRDYLFNWKIWPNFASEGTRPLNQYQYTRFNLGEKTPLQGTNMTVEPHILSHHGSYESTAFIVESSGAYVVYFGDTSPDALEKEKNIEKVWKKVAPLIREGRLHGILLECSYTNEVPDNELYGHLNPKYMMQELEKLAYIVDPTQPESALLKVKVIVTHIKDSCYRGGSPKQVIQDELNSLNKLNIQFVFPEQGQKIEL
jgi:3',5'-cyclic-nucleotide phosphodiesterase